MARARKAAVVACIALVVVAAVLPLGAVSLDWVVVAPAFVLLPPLTQTAVFPELVCRDEQPSALLCTLNPRGPPQSSLA
jgi:hypothetical protein